VKVVSPEGRGILAPGAFGTVKPTGAALARLTVCRCRAHRDLGRQGVGSRLVGDLVLARVQDRETRGEKTGGGQEGAATHRPGIDSHGPPGRRRNRWLAAKSCPYRAGPQRTGAGKCVASVRKRSEHAAEQDAVDSDRADDGRPDCHRAFQERQGGVCLANSAMSRIDRSSVGPCPASRILRENPSRSPGAPWHYISMDQLIQAGAQRAARIRRTSEGESGTLRKGNGMQPPGQPRCGAFRAVEVFGGEVNMPLQRGLVVGQDADWKVR